MKLWDKGLIIIVVVIVIVVVPFDDNESYINLFQGLK